MASLAFAVGLIHAQRLKNLEPAAHVKPGDAIVIGFLGAFEKWDDENRSVRKVVLSLRELPGVHAESVSNHNLSTALKFIERSARAHPRVVIFGQSMGGNATVELARALLARHIPVLLTVQVDSVGMRDGVIPGNVRAAANYYQHDPLTVWGRAEIRAADPLYTRIIGNFERRYPLFDSSYTGTGTSWARKHLGGGHARMEADTGLWAEVEQLIRQALAMHQNVGK